MVSVDKQLHMPHSAPVGSRYMGTFLAISRSGFWGSELGAYMFGRELGLLCSLVLLDIGMARACAVASLCHDMRYIE